jgi:flagellar biosynthesis protein FliQ
MIIGSIIYGILIGIITSEIKIKTFSLKFILILLVSIFLLESFLYFILKYKNVTLLVINKN